MTTSPLDQAKAAIAEAKYAEAAALLAPLTNTGDAEADYLFGTLLFCEPDLVSVDDAMDAFGRAADLDHPAACYQVATTAVDGDEVIAGPVVDADLLLHAAELGHVEAQRLVGVLHVDGDDGFPQDLEVTRQWYERAAEQGHCQSQYDLGWMMLEGEGGPVDEEGALEWLEACALQDEAISETAADFLAAIFEEGRFDFEPDPEAAERWRRRQQELAEALKQERERASEEPGEGPGPGTL
jgi:uncharacterized protein